LLLRDGAVARDGPAAHGRTPWSAALGTGRLSAQTGVPVTVGGTRAGARAPGHQAGEPVHLPAGNRIRLPEGARLRRRVTPAATVGGAHPGGGHGPGHAGVPGAGAGGGTGAVRFPRGPLLAWLRRLLAAHGPSAVRGQRCDVGADAAREYAASSTVDAVDG